MEHNILRNKVVVSLPDLTFKSGETVWGNVIGDITEQADLQIELLKKVDKVSGKQLSTNDFTDFLRDKLNGLTSAVYKFAASDFYVAGRETIVLINTIYLTSGQPATINDINLKEVIPVIDDTVSPIRQIGNLIVLAIHGDPLNPQTTDTITSVYTPLSSAIPYTAQFGKEYVKSTVVEYNGRYAYATTNYSSSGDYNTDIVNGFLNEIATVSWVQQLGLSSQKWLPAVMHYSMLPSTISDPSSNYLCRVINDPNKSLCGVWQAIANGTIYATWTYFSDNLDFIDDLELAAAIGAHDMDATAHPDIRNELDGKVDKNVAGTGNKIVQDILIDTSTKVATKKLLSLYDGSTETFTGVIPVITDTDLADYDANEDAIIQAAIIDFNQ
jgi:hypothetical protein